MCHELSTAGISFERQQSVPIKHKQIKLATPLRLDLIVEGKVIIDNKTEITAIDKQQLLTYLQLCGVRLGLFINVNVIRLVDGVVCVVNGLEDDFQILTQRTRRSRCQYSLREPARSQKHSRTQQAIKGFLTLS